MPTASLHVYVVSAESGSTFSVLTINCLQQNAIGEKVENTIERRWGIVAIAVAMFFVTMVNASINGQKSSIYYVVWMMVGVYGYKGNLEEIKRLMKVLLILNAVVLLGVLMFMQDNAVTYIERQATKESIAFGVLIMCIPKALIYLYCDKEIKEIESKNQQEEEVEKIFKKHANYESNKLIKTQSKKNESMEDAYLKAEEIKSEPKKTIIEKNINVQKPKVIESMEDAYSQMAEQKTSSEKNIEAKQAENKNIKDEEIWEFVAEEFDGIDRKKGLYAKLFAEMDGDDKKIKIAYYKIRVEEIKNNNL